MILNDLWAQVVQRTNPLIYLLQGVLENIGNAKVTDLDLALLGYEDVGGFQVPVNYLAVVDMLHSQKYLSDNVQDFILAQEFLTIKCVSPLLDHLAQVAAVR